MLMIHKPTSRRTVLKSMLATGGAIVGISFLPEKWTRPVVRTGVLPVHASTSTPTYYLQGGYGDFNQEYSPSSVRMNGIFAFVSYDDQSGSIASSGMVHGVPNVPVVLSWRVATTSDPDWNPIWASYTGTLTNGNLPSSPVYTDSNGYVHFDDQIWTYDDPDYRGWYLTFASSACVNSPAEYY
jgi:hypothetical protein